MKLRELRKKQHLTQAQVATSNNLSTRTYASYENDEREAGYATLCKLADFFDVTVDELLGRADPTIIDADHRDVIQCYDQLTPQQQDIIMQCMQCFIGGNIERQKQDDDP